MFAEHNSCGIAIAGWKATLKGCSELAPCVITPALIDPWRRRRPQRRTSRQFVFLTASASMS